MGTIVAEQKGSAEKASQLVEMNWDPITRIVGSLGIFTKIDFGKRKVAECHSTSSIFRGYSIFMKGKDPRDAHFITSRICGICGDNHATCATYAQNMAFGVRPPAMAEWIVNLGEAAEYMFDHNIFQDNLVGVDFCEKMVKETNPGVYEKAEKTQAPHAELHGYRTIADIMKALNPFTGAFYLEALQVSRMTREMFCLMEGRHVHPSTLYPGGVGTVPTIQLFTDYIVRLMKYVEFMKKVVPLHDDLFDFFYEALPGYEEVGRRRILLGCWGSFNNPDVCDYTYEKMTEWGRAMYVTPGVVVDGKLVTTRPGRHQPEHPHSARQLLLRRLAECRDVCEEGSAWKPRRSAPSVEPEHLPQAAEARLQGEVHVGHVPALVRQAHRRLPGARYRRRTHCALLGHGVGRHRRHRLLKATGHSVKIYLPKTASLPEVEFEWKIPKWSNAIERDRARTYFQAYAAAAALHFAEQALAELHAGRTRTWNDFKVPEEAIGCGFHEAVRGVLSHHVVIKNHKIANYHPYPPTPWNANPRDCYGTPGPYEDAVQNTPIFEENGPENFKGIDIMRAVRSFDPCLPCGVHMYLGNGKVLETHHSPMFGLQP
jgi:hydrogenase large subunit